MSARGTVDWLGVAVAYHERTKHRPGRFARSLGYMDWATQPDPFRRFAGAPELVLPLGSTDGGPPLDELSAGCLPPAAEFDALSIGQLFRDSLALSAWKEHGETRWPLRVNPSSGNLHPTEGYLVARSIPGLSDFAAVYHYRPHDHLLEVRAHIEEVAPALFEGLPPEALLVGLTSIHWREAWKYGERAFRYCHHDLGHALAAVSYAAAALGWHCRLLDALTHDELAAVLGTGEQVGPEAERPDALLLLSRVEPEPLCSRFRPSNRALDVLGSVTWLGSPAPLSPDHEHWEVIDEVAHATERRQSPRDSYFTPHSVTQPFELTPRSGPARRLIHQRRSAVEMDGTTSIGKDSFERILLATLPSPGHLPFAALPFAPRVHLLCFVHRVSDLDPGLYLLERAPGAASRARAIFREGLLWERAEVSPALGLHLLVPGDVRQAAKLVSCHQDIASDGVFAVAMLAEVEPGLEVHGAWLYERLHWEAGAIGQVLYLEAEALGIGATGIGCFFDDAVHEILGLRGGGMQALYHFTLGGRVDDPRLRTLEPYAHLSR
ncbi:MAG: SagB/ThcOx family dehydrogenase [Myxococcales bacterium]|nr:SagB/ThcOx family dehydrogenase [Myxococcales bacterium]